jgi:hypothetical protein
VWLNILGQKRQKNSADIEAEARVRPALFDMTAFGYLFKVLFIASKAVNNNYIRSSDWEFSDFFFGKGLVCSQI